MSRNVAIIGAGRLGSSLARIFRRSGANVSMWDQDEGKVRNQKSLEEVVSPADMVFFCIPSFALEDVLKKIKKSLRKGCIVVSPIKGIDHVTGNTTAEVVIKSLPSQPFVMLGGPMIAEELDKGLGGTAVLASLCSRLVGFGHAPDLDPYRRTS